MNDYIKRGEDYIKRAFNKLLPVLHCVILKNSCFSCRRIIPIEISVYHCSFMLYNYN